jgi:LysR family transcriptional regulator, hydrogen peroxide-inducible genes activator
VPTLRQLDYFAAIAETRHFRRAAERANTTQSTLSSQLKALEERLGLKLVERSSRRVTITPIGEEILVIARRILRDEQTIRDIARMQNSGLSGVFRLGVVPTIGPVLLPRIVPLLRQKFPRLKIQAREGPPQQLAAGLQLGRFDAIITVLQRTLDEVTVVKLFDEALLISIASSHPLAAKSTITSADLADLDILTLSNGQPMHTAVRALCQANGAILRDDYEETSLDTLMEMVAGGSGAAFFPELYGRSRIAGGSDIVMREMAGNPLSRTIAMCWRHSVPAPERYRAFAEAVVEASRPLQDLLLKCRS